MHCTNLPAVSFSSLHTHGELSPPPPFSQRRLHCNSGPSSHSLARHVDIRGIRSVISDIQSSPLNPRQVEDQESLPDPGFRCPSFLVPTLPLVLPHMARCSHVA